MNNSLIEAARSGKPPAYWRVALYFVTTIGGGIIATMVLATPVVVIALLLGVTDEDSLFLVAAIPVIIFGAVWMIGFTLIWVRFVDRRPATSIGLRTRHPLREWLRGLLVGAGLMLLSVGLMAALGTIESGGNSLDTLIPLLIADPLPVLGAVGMLLLFLVQGPAEEVVFRGYLLPVLGARGSITLGVVLSSTLFGLLHALNPNFGVLPLVNIVLAGVVFALYGLVEEGLWGVFGLHSAWNWVQGNVLGLPVSGIAFGPSLFGLHEAGPDWLTGGSFGPEGSVVVTLLLVVVSMGLGWRLWHRQKTQRNPEGVGG
jgi:membrane protease YdiL (CAAX protease family)